MAATPNYLRQASQNLGKYATSGASELSGSLSSLLSVLSAHSSHETLTLSVPPPAVASALGPTCTGKAPRARQHRAVGRLSAGAPRLHKSCRWRRPQSKGRSCRSGRARRDLRVRGGRGHLSERPGWPSGAPISRGSTVSMIAFGGRRGPHRSGSRCRGRPIERREAGREGCLWPDAASQGRPPDGSGVESVKASAPLQTAARRPCGGGGGGGGSNSELPQAGFPESGEVYFGIGRRIG